jgi:hypothetical protein
MLGQSDGLRGGADRLRGLLGGEADGHPQDQDLALVGGQLVEQPRDQYVARDRDAAVVRGERLVHHPYDGPVYQSEQGFPASRSR